MKKPLSLLISAICTVAIFAVSQQALAVSMNFTGTFRGEASHYAKPNLGLATAKDAKSFIAVRALLNPVVVVDDHFSIRSQWSLLTSNNFTPNASQALGVGQGGWILGDPNSVSLVMGRAWLEWTSDFGVFRLGRMPVSWGYGLVYDAGNGTWDDFQSTLDRIEYRLHLGHVVGALAYSKGRKLSVLGNDNDQEFYTIYLQYDNPEMEVEGGILFEKQARSASQAADLTNAANPYKVPGSTNPLATRSPYPLSNHLLDAYLRKTVGYLTVGGEVAWISGTAVDFAGNGADNLNAFSVIASASYEMHKVKAFADFLFATGDNDLSADHLNGFVILNRNRRPGIILGRELLGSYSNNTVGQGGLVYYGGANTFSGVIYFRPGLRVDWSPSWASGLEMILARKAAVAAGEEANLGLEFDLGTEYSPYKNFDLGVSLGLLIPGNGLGVPNGNSVFAIRSTAALKF